MKLSRRALLAGSIAASLGYTTARAQQRRLFDSHLHIIDHRFPIIPNQGYTPPHYSAWRPVPSSPARSRATTRPI
jgi:hypothetical protein